MKKIIIICTTVMTVFIAGQSNAQSWTPSGPDLVTDGATNNVGVGDNAPVSKLTINGGMSFTPTTSSIRTINGRTSHYLEVDANTTQADGSVMVLNADNASAASGAVDFIIGGNAGATKAFEIMQYDGGNYNSHVYINKNGKIGLGDNNPQPNERLTINGGLCFTPTTSDIRTIKGRTTHYVEMDANTTQADGSVMVLNADNGSANSGAIDFIVGGNAGSNKAFEIMQYNGGSYNSHVFINKNGNIGLGDNNPQLVEKLTINGGLCFTPTTSSIRTIKGRTSHYLEIDGNTSQADGAVMVLNADASGSPGRISFISGGWSGSDRALDIMQYNGGAHNTLMYMRKDGKMVIGNVDPNTAFDYKLYVENGILTPRVKVAVPGTGDWSDFVFADDYKLMPLSEVEEYIKENKHLPEIPSAEEVVKDGVDLGAMDAKLLQKIEELTLHMIQLQRTNDELKTRLQKLENK